MDAAAASGRELQADVPYKSPSPPPMPQEEARFVTADSPQIRHDGQSIATRTPIADGESIFRRLRREYALGERGSLRPQVEQVEQQQRFIPERSASQTRRAPVAAAVVQDDADSDSDSSSGDERRRRTLPDHDFFGPDLGPLVPGSWLEGRRWRRGQKEATAVLQANKASRWGPEPTPVPSSGPSEDESLPHDPLRLNFKIFSSKVKYEVVSIRVDLENMTPDEVSTVWEDVWGVTYARRIRFDVHEPDGSRRRLNPREDVVPCSPAIIKLEASAGAGGVLYTLRAAMRQYGNMSCDEAAQDRSRRQQEAEAGALRRAAADSMEAGRYSKLDTRCIFERTGMRRINAAGQAKVAG